MAWSKHLHTLLVGLLLGVGFIIPVFWWLGLVGVAMAIQLLITEQLSWQRAWAIGTIKVLCVASWVWRVYPIDWLGFDLGWLELPLIGFYWLTVALSLGAGMILVSVGGRQLVARVPLRYVYGLIPVVWLLSELLGSFLFSILMHGPGGTIGVTFSQTYIGYLLAQHGLLIHAAALGGVYMLVVLFVALGTAGLVLWQRRRSFAVIALLILFSTGMWSPVGQQATDDTALVALVDTWQPDGVWGAASTTIAWRGQLAEAVEQAVDADAQYVLLPEDARYFNQMLDPKLLKATLNFLYNDTNAIIVDSGRTMYEDLTVLQAAVYDGQADELYQSHKGYLVPQGEYMPALYRFLFGLFDEAAVTDALHKRLPYRIGPHVSQAHFADAIPGVLFCFEVFNPRGVRTIMKDRDSQVPFVTHVVSLAWIHDSRILHEQTMSILRVQAIWNDVSIVGVGNYDEGSLITPDGAVVTPHIIAAGDGWRVSQVRVPTRP